MKNLTPEETYKRNEKKAKALKILSPIVFWSFLGLALLCLIFAFKNSFGNMAEIIRLLDDKVYNGEQLEANYNFLLNKYGEWTIGSGGYGFTIRFINISKALFSGLMVANLIACVSLVVLAFLLGKWVLPKLSRQIEDENKSMVNLTILRGAK